MYCMPISKNEMLCRLKVVDHYPTVHYLQEWDISKMLMHASSIAKAKDGKICIL